MSRRVTRKRLKAGGELYYLYGTYPAASTNRSLSAERDKAKLERLGYKISLRYAAGYVKLWCRHKKHPKRKPRGR